MREQEENNLGSFHRDLLLRAERNKKIPRRGIGCRFLLISHVAAKLCRSYGYPHGIMKEHLTDQYSRVVVAAIIETYHHVQSLVGRRQVDISRLTVAKFVMMGTGGGDIENC